MRAGGRVDQVGMRSARVLAVAVLAVALAACTAEPAVAPAPVPARPSAAAQNPLAALAGRVRADGVAMSDVAVLAATQTVCAQQRASGGTLDPTGRALAVRALVSRQGMPEDAAQIVVAEIVAARYC